ncbi:hypothetical protein DMN91_000948 [Ooceraea biroi]|uniref:Uncharacterized protein n=1 Tax=Ooceraea biroi TaxID=2015173 RepID=A0A3L8E4J4_OOCBI|nr:hypothetical protein DMN91_000948 [Ooceraea biroi]
MTKSSSLHRIRQAELRLTQAILRIPDSCAVSPINSQVRKLGLRNGVSGSHNALNETLLIVAVWLPIYRPGLESTADV